MKKGFFSFAVIVLAFILILFIVSYKSIDYKGYKSDDTLRMLALRHEQSYSSLYFDTDNFLESQNTNEVTTFSNQFDSYNFRVAPDCMITYKNRSFVKIDQNKMNSSLYYTVKCQINQIYTVNDYNFYKRYDLVNRIITNND